MKADKEIVQGYLLEAQADLSEAQFLAHLEEYDELTKQLKRIFYAIKNLGEYLNSDNRVNW